MKVSSKDHRNKERVFCFFCVGLGRGPASAVYHMGRQTSGLVMGDGDSLGASIHLSKNKLKKTHLVQIFLGPFL